MKKILTIFLLILASVAVTPTAAAYSAEMAELATMLNKQTDDGVAVSYDGTNIIFSFPGSFFSDEERELLGSMDDLQPFAPVIKQTLMESMGSDSLTMLGTIFSQFDTGMDVRVDLGGSARDIILTGEQLLDPNF